MISNFCTVEFDHLIGVTLHVKKAMFEFGGRSIKPIGKNRSYDKQLMEKPQGRVFFF
jgi:hypothetical protein